MQKGIKAIYKVILLIFYMAGITYLSQRFNDNKIRILMYHRINDRDDSFLPKDYDLYVSCKNFEKQISYLKKNYNIISMDVCCRLLKSKEKLPRKCVVLTFDDGFMDNYTYAYPILRKYQVPATFYIIADTLNKKEIIWLHKYYFLRSKGVRFNVDSKDLKYSISHEKARKLIDEHSSVNYINDLYLGERELKGMEGVSIGSHTRSHVAVSKLTKEERYDELVNSKKMIEKIGVNCKHFAYPFGDAKAFDEESKNIVLEHYNSGVSTCEGFVTKNSDLFALNRLSVIDDDLVGFKNVLGGIRALLIKCYKYYE